MTEDKMIGSHHQLNKHEFEQTLGDGEGQGGLGCCSPWDCKESDTTPQFKNIDSLALRRLYSPTLTSIVTTGKTKALTRWTFVGKVMSLLFNVLSRFVIAFLPRSKRL